MSTNLQKAVENIATAARDATPDSKTIVTYRPNAQMAAMIEIISRLSGRAPSALLAEMLPPELAKYVYNEGLAEPIANAYATIIERSGYAERGSALDRIEKNGLIKVADAQPTEVTRRKK